MRLFLLVPFFVLYFVPPSTRALAIAAAFLAVLSIGSVGCKPKEKPAPAKGTAAATPGATEKTSPAEQKAAARKAAEAEKDRARQAASEAVPVEVAPIVRGPISAFLTFNSTLETEALVDVFPQASGQVETLFVEEGRVVKAGDPLLKIDDREVRVDAEESQTNYEHLKKNFARTQDLFQRNLINQQDHETQAYQLDQARLRLERAKIRLAYTTVRAPFDGVIATREAQIGARVGTGSKAFSMLKLDDIVARVFVPGRYLTVVAADQAAVVTSEFLPDRSFNGWVKRISPVIDPKSGTFKVTVGVRGEKPSDLPPGLFVGVRIITDTRQDAVLVPKRAVVYEGGERYVFMVVNGKAAKRKLVAGFEDPLNVEALSGLEVGGSVIVLGHSGLKDGAMVRTVNAPTVPAGAAPSPDNAKEPAIAPKATSAAADQPKSSD